MIFCTTSVDAPWQELFIRSFRFVVALLVSRKIDFFVRLHRMSNPAVRFPTIGHTLVYPIMFPLYLLPSVQKVLQKLSKSMYQIKIQQKSLIVARPGQPSGTNVFTGTSSNMNEGGLVLWASRRPTRAPILASLGARSQN